MVIKSYVAPSVAGALKMIRAELGSKAVVLKTRGLTARESGVGRRMVEITACLENPSVGALSSSLADPKEEIKTPMQTAPVKRSETLAALQAVELQSAESDTNMRNDKLHNEVDEPSGSSISGTVNDENQSDQATRPGMVDIRDMESFAKRLEEKLDLILDTQLTGGATSEVPSLVAPIARLIAAHDIPERFSRAILRSIIEKINSGSEDKLLEYAEEVLVAEFAARCVPEMLIRPGDVALFIGPAGSGKTSVLGKVAVDLLFNKKIKTELSTLDDFRIAAQEEITSCSEALGAAYVDADEVAATLKHTIQAPERALLVDCHSNINDQRQFMRLKDRAEALKPTVVFLVVSALTRSSDVSRLVRRFESFNPTHIIATHTDLTDTVGGIYTASIDSGLKICALTNSPGSFGNMLPPDPGAMARRILERNK